MTSRMTYQDQASRVIQSQMRQLPYAVSLTLNDVANQFQRVEQDRVRRSFTLRQVSFILNSIKRVPGQDFATKTHLAAAVQIDPRRNELAKFEAGGEKVSLQGKPYVAVPSKEIKRTKRDLIPRRFYPSQFKPFTDQANGVTLGQQRTFIVPVKGGNRLMLQRYGGARGKHGVRALYLFTPSVTIDARLGFVETATTVARSAFPSAFAQAWARALRTAR